MRGSVAAALRATSMAQARVVAIAGRPRKSSAPFAPRNMWTPNPVVAGLRPWVSISPNLRSTESLQRSVRGPGRRRPDGAGRTNPSIGTVSVRYMSSRAAAPIIAPQVMGRRISPVSASGRAGQTRCPATYPLGQPSLSASGRIDRRHARLHGRQPQCRPQPTRPQLVACAGRRAGNIVDLDSARRRSRTTRQPGLRTSS